MPHSEAGSGRARRPAAPSRSLAQPAALTVLSVLGAAAGAVALLLVARDEWRAIDAPGPAAPSDGILLAVAVAGSLLALWFLLCVLLAAMAALPGRSGRACRAVADRLTPACARRVVALVLGSTLTATALPGTGASAEVAGPQRRSEVAAAGHLTHARPLHGRSPEPRPEFPVTGRVETRPAPTATMVARHDPSRAGEPAPSEPDPAWTPGRPAPPVHTAVDPSLGVLRSSTGARQVEEHVVVRRGDTLWDIAARHLGPEATAAQIAQDWPRWYAANRSLIGDDPDLILPGQRLVPPTYRR